MSLYNTDGQINLTAVDGSSYTGLYAVDVSFNIVINDGSTYTGLFHPCGALNAVVVTDPYAGYFASNGSVNVIVNSSGGYSPVVPAGNGTALTGGVNFASGYPADNVTGVTYSIVVGIAALTANWKNGPLFDLVLPNTSTTTINAVGVGYPDVQSIADFIGVDAHTGIGAAQIDKWYNKLSGSPASIVAAGTGSVKPMLYLIGGKVYVGYGGTLTRSDGGGLNAPYFTSDATINNQSFSLFAALNSYTSSNAGAINNSLYSTVISSGTGTTATNILVADQGCYLNNLAVPPQVTGYSATADFTSGFSNQLQPSIGIQPMLLSAVGNATGTSLWTNGTNHTGPVLVAGSGTTPINIGNDTTNTGIFSGRMQAIILSSSIFTTEQEATMRSSLAAWAGINTAVNRANDINIVVTGASTDEGQGSDPMGQYKTLSGGGYGYVEILKDKYITKYPTKKISWYNAAISGNTIAIDTANYTSGWIPNTCFQSGSTKNVIIIANSAVGNTLAGNGDSGSSAFTDFEAEVTAVKANSWTRIATILFPSLDQGVIDYNNLVKANAASLGIDVIDMTADTNIGVVPTYANVDGHPTIAGSVVMSGYIDTYLSGLI